MRILSRYFVSGYLTFYAAIVTVSMLVIAIIEMMVNFDDVFEYGEGLAGVASYLLLRLPSYYLPYLIPVGSFGAAFLCLGLPARSLEILAAKASGISPRRLAAPVLIAAAALSVFALILNETIVLDTSRRLDHEHDGGHSGLFQTPGTFWYHRGDRLFSVQEADRASRTLRHVTIYERDRHGRLLRTIHAETARIETGRRWRLENALFREFSANDPEAAPRTESRETAWIELGSASDLTLLDADGHSLSLPGLGAYIEALDREGRNTNRYRAMWHMRLADPLGVLLFALLGAPLGIAVERSRSLAVAALQSVALLGVYYMLQTTAIVFGSSGVAAAVVAPWIVLAAFGALAAWRLARVGA